MNFSSTPKQNFSFGAGPISGKPPMPIDPMFDWKTLLGMDTLPNASGAMSGAPTPLVPQQAPNISTPAGPSAGGFDPNAMQQIFGQQQHANNVDRLTAQREALMPPPSRHLDASGTDITYAAPHDIDWLKDHAGAPTPFDPTAAAHTAEAQKQAGVYHAPGQFINTNPDGQQPPIAALPYDPMGIPNPNGPGTQIPLNRDPNAPGFFADSNFGTVSPGTPRKPGAPSITENGKPYRAPARM